MNGDPCSLPPGGWENVMPPTKVTTISGQPATGIRCGDCGELLGQDLTAQYRCTGEAQEASVIRVGGADIVLATGGGMRYKVITPLPFPGPTFGLVRAGARNLHRTLQLSGPGRLDCVQRMGRALLGLCGSDTIGRRMAQSSSDALSIGARRAYIDGCAGFRLQRIVGIGTSLRIGAHRVVFTIGRRSPLQGQALGGAAVVRSLSQVLLSKVAASNGN